MILAPSKRKPATDLCIRLLAPHLTSQGRGDKEAIPITVKASNELAKTIVAELKKGVAFVVEGQLAYYKNPDTNRETYSIWAESFTDITPPKSTAVKSA